MAAHNIQNRLGKAKTSQDSSYEEVAIRSAAKLFSTADLVSLNSGVQINSGLLSKLLDGITNIFNEFGEWGETDDGQKVKSELASLYKSFADKGGQATPPKRRSDKIEKVYVDPDGNKFHIVVIPYDDEEGTSDIVINLNRFNNIPNDKIEETVLDYIDSYAEKGGQTAQENDKEEIVYVPGSRSKKDDKEKMKFGENILDKKISGSSNEFKPKNDFAKPFHVVGKVKDDEVSFASTEKSKGGDHEPAVLNFVKDKLDSIVSKGGDATYFINGTAVGKDGNLIISIESVQKGTTDVKSSTNTTGKTRILASTKPQTKETLIESSTTQRGKVRILASTKTQSSDRTGYCPNCYRTLSKRLGSLKNIVEIYPEDEDEDLVCKECGEGEWDHLIQAQPSKIESVNPGTTTNTGEPGLWELVSDIKNLKGIVLSGNGRMPVTSMEVFNKPFTARSGSDGSLIFDIKDSVYIPYRVEEAFRETVGYEVRRVLEDNGMLNAGTGNLAHAPILNKVDVRGSIVGDGGQVMWVIDSILAHEEGTPHGQPINSGHAGLPRGAAGYGEHDYGDLIEESARKSKDRSKLLVGRPWSYGGASGYEILTPPNWADSIANLNFFRQETGYKAEGSGFSDSFRVRTGRITQESYSALKQAVDNFNRGEFE
jgi:hypothetical protein